MAQPRPARSLPLASLPPRTVPWSLHLSALFGGFFNQFGWLFFGFGMVFFWVFGANADLSGPLFAFTPVDTAPGLVLGVEGTSFSEGGDGNSMPVYRIRFAYNARGRSLEGVAYATGYAPENGVRVTVEILRWHPTVARLAGTRRAAFPALALLVVMFPLVGLGFLVPGVRDGLKATRLLRLGRLTTGKLISREVTNMSINHQPVMKLTFEFTAHDGSTSQGIAKTHQPQALEDEAEEPLLCDPADPSTAVLLDSVAGSPRLDPAGQYEPRPMSKVIPLLIVPLLSIVGHTGYLLLSLLR